MTSPWKLLAEANELIAELDAAVPTVDRSTCRHCGEPIVFKPYFLDGRQPNPAKWFHPPGSTTCSTRPREWSRDSWPHAEPADRP